VLLLIGAAVMVVAVFAALRFAGGWGDDVPATAMTRGDVEKIVRNYLLENPEVIFEAADRMKAKENDQRIAAMRASAQKHATAMFKESEPIVAGNPKGDVTIVEFFDYNCQFCRRIRNDLVNLLKQDGNVRLVLKEYPILGPESAYAARAAVAALPQGKYWDFHLALLGAEDLSPPSIFKIAKDVGIDVAKLKAEMGSPKTDARLKEVQKLGRDVGVDATPTFFVGDQPFAGAMSLDELKDAVAKARKAKPS
jgi:protein-disulfide isomerase